MRHAVLAFVLLLAACGQSADAPDPSANAPDAAAAGDDREVVATLALAPTGPGGCSASWDGRAATPQQVLERSTAAVEQAIAAAGGMGNVTREVLPALAVEAPAGLGFACADSFLSAVRRAGVVSILLSPGGGQAPALADFALSEIGTPPSVAVTVGRGGVLAWNGEAVTLAAVTERARQMGGSLEAAIEAPPGALELRPAREASFGQVYEALRAVRQGRVRAALLLPSVPPASGPPPRSIPPPPDAVDGPGNATNAAMSR
ncbi:MAG TPA: hypothetical protein VMG08_19185 [Allosphingosinicella sp.]|nr:hypothetical protein [Allosphingosinicella sp.]